MGVVRPNRAAPRLAGRGDPSPRGCPPYAPRAGVSQPAPRGGRGSMNNDEHDMNDTEKKTTTTPRARFFRAQLTALGPRALHSPAQAASWVALEAELADSRLPPAGLARLIVVLPPHAPRALRKAGIGGVVLAPLDHELLEVTAALPPHPSRSVWLHRRE